MRKKVLMAFDDPGGGLAVSSLIKKLNRGNEFEVFVYAGILNGRSLKQRKIDFKEINSFISEDAAEVIISECLPDILITGTSGGDAEQKLRNAAYINNIKSIVVLDFWKDYARRWKYASYSLADMKDKICVMDEITKDEMIAEGFPERNLIVTGQPYLDEILNYELNDFNDDSEMYKPARISFLFLSQPLKVIGIEDYKIHPLKNLLDAVNKLSESKREKYSLIIKLHPLEEDSEELQSIVDSFNSDNLRVQFSDESGSLKDLILASEAVIGYNSIALFESIALNKRTISLQAGPVRDSLIKAMDSAGIEIIDADVDSIFDCLQKKVSEDPVLKDNLFKGGIDNCLRVIKDELNLKQSEK